MIVYQVHQQDVRGKKVKNIVSLVLASCVSDVAKEFEPEGADYDWQLVSITEVGTIVRTIKSSSDEL